jgi:L-Ala-D/L-Glu epimerase
MLPFISPLETAKGSIARRLGFLVRLYDDAGNEGVGDVATLPEFGSETRAAAYAELYKLAADPAPLSAIEPNPRSIFNGLSFLSNVPATRFGVEQALIDLSCRRLRATPGEFLRIPPVHSIPVNALVGMVSALKVRSLTMKIVDEGYTTLKLKAGRSRIEDDVRCIEAVRTVSDKISIRVDVNRRWSRSEAPRNLDRITPFGIEHVEDPIEDADPSAYAALRSRAAIKIAVDEPVRTPEDVLRFVRSGAIDTLIVKPVLCGGALGAIRMMHTAREYGVGIVVSSAFESAVGRQMNVVLASSVPDTAHGLDTARLFERDVADDPWPVRGGRIYFEN